ncbi:Ig-like domain-containing protein [Methanobrevibacter sp.]
MLHQTVEGKNYPVNVTNGKGQLTIPGLKAGEKQVTAKYPGNETYKPSENSTTFKVKKIKPDLTVDSHDIYVGDDETITVTLPADATGKVTITVDGKKYTKDLENGKATFTIPGLKTGKYTVDASYSGDDKYLSTTGKDTFNVLKHKPDINVDSPDITVGEDGVVTVTLPDDATGSLTIEIDGKTYTANVKNGKAVFRIPGLNVGSYGIKVSYSGDDKYLPTKTTGEMNVLDKNGNDKAKSVKVQDSHATGNPIFILFVVLISMIVVNIRKFKK